MLPTPQSTVAHDCALRCDSTAVVRLPSASCCELPTPSRFGAALCVQSAHAPSPLWRSQSYDGERLLRERLQDNAGASSDGPEAIVAGGNRGEPLQVLLDEFRALQLLTEKPMSFGERVLAFPSATTYWAAPKNRYPDVLPKEETRVRLRTLNGVDDSEYINANFIFDREYIATQAPIPSSFCDFWRMIWEQCSPVIVMLTRLTERRIVKASVYWPQNLGETAQYGSLTVQLVNEVSFSAIDVRIFAVSDGKQHREVAHLHYTGWPDSGVPCNVNDIFDLVRTANFLREQLSCKHQGPLVAHCSAGIGRAGTFIAVHQAAQLISIGIVPKILDLVYCMRQCRNGMVQNEEQYLFIHRCALAIQHMHDARRLLFPNMSLAVTVSASSSSNNNSSSPNSNSASGTASTATTTSTTTTTSSTLPGRRFNNNNKRCSMDQSLMQMLNGSEIINCADCTNKGMLPSSSSGGMECN